MRFLVLIIITTMIVAAEETVKLPSSTEYAVKKHEQAIEKARVAYIKSFESIKEDTAKVMDKEIEKATKSGDLDLAIAIKTKAEEISKSSAFDVKEAKSDLLGNEIKKSFEDIKGKEYKLMANEPLTIQVPEISGYKFKIVPSETDKWASNARLGETNWEGYKDHKTYGLTTMCIILIDKNGIKTELNPKKEIPAGTYIVQGNDSGFSDNIGFITIKLISEK